MTDQKSIPVDILLTIADKMEPRQPGYGRKYLDSKGIRYLVDKCATVGIAEVVHSKWNYDGSCGNCGVHVLSNYMYFCPHCGADMREVKND